MSYTFELTEKQIEGMVQEGIKDETMEACAAEAEKNPQKFINKKLRSNSLSDIKLICN